MIEKATDQEPQSFCDSHGTAAGWFADVSDEDERDERWPWQPFIQTAGGCFPLPVWFDNKEACEDFIRRDVLRRGMLRPHLSSSSAQSEGDHE